MTIYSKLLRCGYDGMNEMTNKPTTTPAALFLHCLDSPAWWIDEMIACVAELAADRERMQT